MPIVAIRYAPPATQIRVSSILPMRTSMVFLSAINVSRRCCRSSGSANVVSRPSAVSSPKTGRPPTRVTTRPFGASRSFTARRNSSALKPPACRDQLRIAMLVCLQPRRHVRAWTPPDLGREVRLSWEHSRRRTLGEVPEAERPRLDTRSYRSGIPLGSALVP